MSDRSSHPSHACVVLGLSLCVVRTRNEEERCKGGGVMAVFTFAIPGVHTFVLCQEFEGTNVMEKEALRRGP